MIWWRMLGSVGRRLRDGWTVIVVGGVRGRGLLIRLAEIDVAMAGDWIWEGRGRGIGFELCWNHSIGMGLGLRWWVWQWVLPWKRAMSILQLLSLSPSLHLLLLKPPLTSPSSADLLTISLWVDNFHHVSLLRGLSWRGEGAIARISLKRPPSLWNTPCKVNRVVIGVNIRNPSN